jgi:hypothetical protein
MTTKTKQGEFQNLAVKKLSQGRLHRGTSEKGRQTIRQTFGTSEKRRKTTWQTFGTSEKGRKTTWQTFGTSEKGRKTTWQTFLGKLISTAQKLFICPLLTHPPIIYYLDPKYLDVLIIGMHIYTNEFSSLDEGYLDNEVEYIL